jgi:hypothetical protein
VDGGRVLHAAKPATGGLIPSPRHGSPRPPMRPRRRRR